MPEIFKQIAKKIFIHQNKASIGIGGMIIFIAMILVAGIAASILIQTSNTLEVQAMQTGQESRDEVSSGVRVLDISGQHGNRNVSGTYYDRYHNMSIVITARPGTDIVNLDDTVITISNGEKKCALAFANHFAIEPSGSGVFQTTNLYDLNASEFGIIVIEDGDGSCTEANPGMTPGDKIILTVNLSALFNGLQGRIEVRGMIIIEQGYPGIFQFVTPSTSSKTVVELF